MLYILKRSILEIKYGLNCGLNCEFILLKGDVRWIVPELLKQIMEQSLSSPQIGNPEFDVYSTNSSRCFSCSKSTASEPESGSDAEN